jgi:hypothetical protein
MKFTLTPPPAGAFKFIKNYSLRGLARAVARATDQTMREGKTDIRRAMDRAKLGKLSRVVDYTSDVKKRRVPDITSVGARWRAGATIYARGSGSKRASGALAAYTNGKVTILPKRGRWLAIATDELAKRVPGIKGSGRRRSGTFRMTPELYRKRGLEKRIGKLVFVPGSSPNEALLIVNNVQVNAARGFGKAERIPRTGRIRAGKVKKDFIVAFVLIRVTRRAERVNPGRIVGAQIKRMDRRITNILRGERPVVIGGKTVAGWSTSFTR